MDKRKNAEKLRPEHSRRKFLKSAGKMAIYIPPAMMVLAKPSLANMQDSYTNGQAPV